MEFVADNDTTNNRPPDSDLTPYLRAVRYIRFAREDAATAADLHAHRANGIFANAVRSGGVDMQQLEELERCVEAMSLEAMRAIQHCYVAKLALMETMAQLEITAERRRLGAHS
jgi:hypothetical protein